jgi:hypothetical protein
VEDITANNVKQLKSQVGGLSVNYIAGIVVREKNV